MNDACFIPTVRYLLQIASNTGEWKTVAYLNDPEEARRTMANVLVIGILGLAGLMLVIGFALVGLAAAGVLVVGAILSGLLRSLSQR
jgi:hypothetical protein